MTVCYGLTWDTPSNSNKPLLAHAKWKSSISFPLTGGRGRWGRGNLQIFHTWAEALEWRDVNMVLAKETEI